MPGPFPRLIFTPASSFFDRRSQYLQLQIEAMYSSNASDGYPQKPGSSAPPTPPVDGIPVQPMNQSYANYGAQDNPLPTAGLHGRPINNVPWSFRLFSCFDDVPTCKSSGIFPHDPFGLEVDQHLIEQLRPCIRLLGRHR